jgi:hypothetical protein
MTGTKFSLGQLAATPGALQALKESGQAPDFFLARHAAGDWGEVDQDDWRLNDEALADGGRPHPVRPSHAEGQEAVDHHRGC